MRSAAAVAAVAAALLFALAPAATADPAQLPPHSQLARDLLAELVALDTTGASGDTTAAAEAVARRLRDAGFSAEDVRVVGAGPHKGNLIARLRGSGARAPLLLLAHLDTVDVRREDWSSDPFTLVERDGYFYGRGVVDDKGRAALLAATLIRLRRERWRPDRDILLVLSADGASGAATGVRWLLDEHRDLVEAGLVIGAGGAGRVRAGEYLYNALAVGEKAAATFRLEARGAGGTSGQAPDDRAIDRLAAAVARLGRFELPARPSEQTRATFARLAAVEGGRLGADLRAAVRQPPSRAAIGRLARLPIYNALLRTTCVTTRLDAAGAAPGSLPTVARAVVSCRLLPGDDPEAVRRDLETLVGDPRVVVSLVDAAPAAAPSAVDPIVLAVVEQITESLWPGVPVVPTVSPEPTDSRLFRAAGVATYGVSGLFVDIDDPHGRNERLGVMQFFEAQEFSYRLIRALTGP